ncbi:MAG: nuclear transport factor 2 family protein [Chloroflexota bacterium]
MVETMVQSPELEAFMRHCHERIAASDSALAEAFTHHDGVLMIGSDAREWWTGHDEVKRIWETQLRELGGRMEVEPGDLRACREGDVGWIAGRPTFRLPDGAAIPMRINAVAHREDRG